MTTDPAPVEPDLAELSSGPPARRSRSAFVAAGVVAIVGVLATVAFVMVGSGERTADDRLAAAQRFLAEARSYTYEAGATDVMGVPGDRPGSVTTTRTHSVVEVAGADRWRALTDHGDFADETVRFGDRAWFRSAEGIDRLEHQLWVEGAADVLTWSDAELEEMLNDPEEWGFGPVDMYFERFAYGADPAVTVELITQATEPELLASDAAGVTLGLRPAAPEGMDDGEVEVRLELDLDTDDVPTALRIDATADDLASEVEIRFTGWDVPVEIVEPPAESVDPTPWVDEDAVRGYAGSTVLAPAVLPAGWELAILDVYPAEETFESCEQLNLYYTPVPADPGSDMAWEEEDYFDLNTLPAECAVDVDDTPFEDQPVGPASRYDGAELRVGDTVIQIDTSLTGAERDAAVASLAPVDLEALLAGFSARQAELDELYAGS
jgi:hypothetical protein